MVTSNHIHLLVWDVGDTQKSQTISTELQGIAEQTACNSGGLFNSGSPPIIVGENSFGKIRMLAKNNPDTFKQLKNSDWNEYGKKNKRSHQGTHRSRFL